MRRRIYSNTTINYTESISLALSVPLATNISTRNVMKIFMRNRKGFTLAETLITLTIIGVIAAMTVPTLVTNYTKQTYVTGLKKVYSQLQNAVRMATISEGCSTGDYSCLFDSNKTYYAYDLEPIMNQLKIVKQQKFDEDESCKDLMNNYNYSGSLCWIAADGVQFTSTAGEGLPGIVADINGAKGPNIWGRDRFIFFISKEDKNNISTGTVLPFGSKIHSKYTYNDFYWDNNSWPPACTTQNVKKGYANGWKCAGRVLEEGKMDY